MKKITYEQAYKDYCFIHGIASAAEYPEGAHWAALDALFKSPTKATAKTFLIRLIKWWFSVGPDDGTNRPCSWKTLLPRNPELANVAMRYGFWGDEPEEDEEE